MAINFLFRGLLIGFCVAAPVGAIGILCINRTLNQGRLVGLFSGLGAATADAVYGFIGGFGLTLVADVLLGEQFWLRLVGGIFLCYLGGKTFYTKPTPRTATQAGNSLVRAYVSTFVLTLANPATIFSFAAIFAGLGLANTAGNYGALTMLVTGVFLGSAMWWLFLSGGVSLFRHKVTPQRLRLVNYICGVIIIAFGLLALGSVFS